MYTCVYGLGMYFYSLLMTQVKASPHYTILLDECLNTKLQECQMDIIVRYWDEESAGMKVRYLDLKFMLRRNEVNLYKLITESICEVDGGGKLLQMSSDGPHVNWSLKSIMDKARAEKSSCHKLILEAVDCMLSRVPFRGLWEGDNMH